jgi:hypothetical protein
LTKTRIVLLVQPGAQQNLMVSSKRLYPELRKYIETIFPIGIGTIKDGLSYMMKRKEFSDHQEGIGIIMDSLTSQDMRKFFVLEKGSSKVFSGWSSENRNQDSRGAIGNECKESAWADEVINWRKINR